MSAGTKGWADGAGWQNGFLTVTDSDKTHGKALKYTEGYGYGVFYTRWVELKPNTEYSFAFDMKILKSGAGKLTLLEDRMDLPVSIMGFEFDADIYGEDWGSYYVQFNSGVYTRVGIAVCNEGGEALLDNLRLFETAKGIVPAVEEDPIDPTDSDATTTTIVNGTTSTTVEDTTDTTTSPTEEGDTAPTTAVADDDEDVADTDGAPQPKREKSPWLLIGIIGAVLVIGGGVALYLYLRKKRLV